MIVKIVYNEGDEKTTELISVKDLDFKRLKEIAKASNIELSREEWYEIYTAAGHVLP